MFSYRPVITVPSICFRYFFITIFTYDIYYYTSYYCHKYKYNNPYSFISNTVLNISRRQVHEPVFSHNKSFSNLRCYYLRELIIDCIDVNFSSEHYYILLYKITRSHKESNLDIWIESPVF